MQTNPHHQLPPLANQPIDIDELMRTTLRLSDILTEESEYLAAMKLDKLAALHEEKLKLTRLMESYQQRLAADASLINRADPATREELLLMTDDLAYAAQENFRHTAVARAVNQRVMQAIMEVVSEQHRPGIYDRQGQASAAGSMAVSINLNQKA